MRVMIIVNSSPASEGGEKPSSEFLTAMLNYNNDLVTAGVLRTGASMHPSSQGVRLTLDAFDVRGKDDPEIQKGPFGPPEKVASGFWVWNVDSVDDAIKWLKKAPFDKTTSFEIRPLVEFEDFDPVLTDESVKKMGKGLQEKYAA